MKQPVLLVIDAQKGFFENDMKVYDAQGMLSRMAKVIGKARRENVPIVFVRHEIDLEIDGPIHALQAVHDGLPDRALHR